ncbi:MAG TPA: hypothetical protein VMQ86_00075 [Bryobacteraceae bacterium]|nr:hypothetical protein [Bryobacteraceae bacterium]
MNGKKRLGKWLLYSLCLAPAAIMLGYYWLDYIPSQREYFMSLRFRSLAMMGDQLRIKIERLGTSFNYAVGPDRKADPFRYISALVTDLTYPAPGCVASKLPQAESGKVVFGNPENTVRFYPKTGCPAEALLPQIFSGFSRDDLFDDVLIAQPAEGRVIYQRSTSSPRIATVAELLKTAAGAKDAPAQGNGRDADAVRTVVLGGSEFALLIQPVRIAASGGQDLQICGLVSSKSLAREARHVPPQYLLALFAPLLIVSLSSPFLKTLLLTRTGRLAFHDLALLGLFTAIAAALIALLLASGRQYRLGEQTSEQQLAAFANALNDQMFDDMKRMRGILDRFDARLSSAIGQVPNRTDLSATDPGLTADLDPSDFVFWANEDGNQVAKWTTSLFNFPQVPQSSQENFQNVVGGELWSVEGKPFTLQTVVSQTTSKLIVIMAMPSHVRVEPAGPGNPGPSPIVSVALVAQLRSLTWPVVPPGAGFAVIRPDGLVLFHSQPDRNLRENLFEEIRSPEPLRTAVANREELSQAAFYRGRKFQFHLQPVKGIAGIPWSIAVFEEIEPRQEAMVRVWRNTALRFGLLLCVIGAMSLSVVAILGLVGRSWRQQVDFFLDRLWPTPSRKPVFERLAWYLCAGTAASLGAAVWAAAHAYSSTGWTLALQCLLPPVAATSFAAWRLWKVKPATEDLPCHGEKEIAYFVCLTLCLVLLAVLPVLGLWGISEANETHEGIAAWQQELAKTIDARRSQRRADIRSSRALSEQAKCYFLGQVEDAMQKDVIEAGRSVDIEEKYVAGFWGTRIVKPNSQTWRDVSGQPEAPGVMPCRTEQGGMKLSCAGTSGPISVDSTLPPIGIPMHALWWVAGLALLGCAYLWNQKAFGRLFLLDFRYSPLPLFTRDWTSPPPPIHLLVLGLPIAGKDAAVREWLGYAPPRVNLYTARFSEGWIEANIAILKGQLATLSAPLALAAAAGETGQSAPARAAAVARNWVHVSNLEAKLSQASDRQVTADLIEKLIMMDVGEDRVRLIVTSVVDPVSHFDSVLSDERKKIYENPLPEPELQRLARLLHNFRKVQVAGPGKQPTVWPAGEAGKIVYEECRPQQALLDIGREVAECAARGTDREMLWQMIAERALALYKLYWSSCTRAEKLVLIQLAQTGFVNPLCGDTLEELIRKGLILPGRRPRVMNETFRQFLETVEGPDTVHKWESEGGESSWPIVRNILLVLIIIGLAVVGLADHEVMQKATGALTGVVTLMAILSRVLGYVTGRRADPPAESA